MRQPSRRKRVQKADRESEIPLTPTVRSPTKHENSTCNIYVEDLTDSCKLNDCCFSLCEPLGALKTNIRVIYEAIVYHLPYQKTKTKNKKKKKKPLQSRYTDFILACLPLEFKCQGQQK